MVRSRTFGFARAALPETDRTRDDGVADGGAPTDTVGEPSRSSRRAPRPPKRWRLLVVGGTASAFVRESPRDEPVWATPRRIGKAPRQAPLE
jgi:hypothetical protein